MLPDLDLLCLTAMRYPSSLLEKCMAALLHADPLVQHTFSRASSSKVEVSCPIPASPRQPGLAPSPGGVIQTIASPPSPSSSPHSTLHSPLWILGSSWSGSGGGAASTRGLAPVIREKLEPESPPSLSPFSPLPSRLLAMVPKPPSASAQFTVSPSCPYLTNR